MQLTSPAYGDGGIMPVRFATPRVAGGTGSSVPLAWNDVPAGSRSLVLALIDTHPVAHGWVHWLVVDIPAEVADIAEGAPFRPPAVELTTSWGTRGYGGPQPPVGSGVHDYVMDLFALDVAHLEVGEGAEWEDVRAAMEGHVLGRATLTGRFGR
jgi:Raf kinase inhibitor-like YbhB/YbcL family protein